MSVMRNDKKINKKALFMIMNYKLYTDSNWICNLKYNAKCSSDTESGYFLDKLKEWTEISNP